MTEDLGWVELGVRPDTKTFPTDLARQIGPGLDAQGTKIGSRFSSGFKKAIIGAGIGGALTAAVKLGGDAISLASDLAESQNKVQQVFGKSADKVFAFTSKTADAYGQTNQQARDAAATFGIFGHAADLNEKKTAKFAIRMDKLASDLASFHNTSPEQAIQAIGSALRGESEPIRAYGVLLDEASLKAEALKIGLLEPVKDQAKIQKYQVAITEGQQKYNDAIKEFGPKSLEALKAQADLEYQQNALQKATEGTVPALTQQQKVIAAQKLILEQTKVAQGDFARTSDGLANSQRRLSARWEDAKTKLGTALLPVMQDFVGFILDKGIPAVEDFSDWFTKTGIPALKKFNPFLKGAAGHAKDLIGFLKDLPDPAKYAGLAALVGGVAAAKVRGGGLGGGGALGTVGSALGLTKPVRVFVTNPGFGGDGTGTGGDGRRSTSRAGRAGQAAALLGLPILDELSGGKASDVALHPLREAFAEFSMPFTKQGRAELFGPSLDDVTKQLVASAEYWHDYEFNGKSAFSAVERAVESATPLMVRYNRVLDGTPRQIKTWVGLSGFEKAMGQIATLRDGIDALGERGLDNGLPYLHGGQTGGPVINIGPVHVKDGRDLLKKGQQAALGGRPNAS